MSVNDVAEMEQLSVATTQIRNTVEIPGAPAVVLQTLDLARHVAIDPKGKRYIVASFDDNHMGRGFVSAVFPQQNGYLTLVRLPYCEFSFDRPEEAVQRHIELVEIIQQGKFRAFLKSQQQ
ncbi:hypothetical protein [Tengunoibacter tsumagoiensis]|uniref:Uncharacterized protein n=1 Tax=Tengunoibacter tsumagoiensis TaxID=2014871 RepID=A0A401ZYB3_9CHLR|nr:hypothetical protein [Tengunoibacter tsumagoiensis]GCE11839.1 hypothetical protein KTT_16980 [Tengunoibacter tsumagoiensis]